MLSGLINNVQTTDKLLQGNCYKNILWARNTVQVTDKDLKGQKQQ